MPRRSRGHRVYLSLCSYLLSLSLSIPSLLLIRLKRLEPGAYNICLLVCVCVCTQKLSSLYIAGSFIISLDVCVHVRVCNAEYLQWGRHKKKKRE